MKNCFHRWTPCYGDILSLVWTTLAEGAQVTPLLLVQQAASEIMLVDVAEPFVGIATGGRSLTPQTLDSVRPGIVAGQSEKQAVVVISFGIGEKLVHPVSQSHHVELMAPGACAPTSPWSASVVCTSLNVSKSLDFCPPGWPLAASRAPRVQGVGSRATGAAGRSETPSLR